MMTLSPRLAIHRGLRSLGLHLQRWRDPYKTAVRCLANRSVLQVVDGGAYHGSVSRRLAELFPLAKIHAFEPQSTTYQVLRDRVLNETRIATYQFALSDRVGTATLHINDRAYTTSLLQTAVPSAMNPVGEEMIRTTTLDAWAAEHGITVDFLKLDLQGHELAALRGATAVLQSAQALLVEVNFQQRYYGSCLFHEVADFCRQHGLALHSLAEIITERDGRWRQADALFFRSEGFGTESPNGSVSG